MDEYDVREAMNLADMEIDDLREAVEELSDTLRKWVNLAERTSYDHATRLDANRLADFRQGIRETKDTLERIGNKS